MQPGRQQKSYRWDETLNTTPTNIWATLLAVCRPLSPNLLIPIEKPSCFFILQVGCCVALRPLGGAGHKTASFPNLCWLYSHCLRSFVLFSILCTRRYLPLSLQRPPLKDNCYKVIFQRAKMFSLAWSDLRLLCVLLGLGMYENGGTYRLSFMQT